MTAVRETVYGVTLPSEFTAWASSLDGLMVSFGDLFLPSWTCVGPFRVRLLTSALWPLLFIVAAAALLLLRAALRRARGMPVDFGEAVMQALSWPVPNPTPRPPFTSRPRSPL